MNPQEYIKIAGCIIAGRMSKMASYAETGKLEVDFTEGDLTPSDRPSTKLRTGTLPGGLSYDSVKRPGPMAPKGVPRDRFPVLHPIYGD